MKNKLIVSTKNTNLEIERKFLLKNNLPELKEGRQIIQAYIFHYDNKELRIRIVDSKCTLSIKVGAGGVSREEFEYEIPIEEGRRLIQIGSSKPPIKKIRYIAAHEDMNWEIDVFEGDNEGLVIAEIELDHPHQQFNKPDWVGKEVTEDRRYYNASIYYNPYNNWSSDKV